ncbi:ACT domain-containing protein [Marinobacter sp. NFXS9]|uniref:ACT domain-containing protein n=1 Tax=Marinobacter sp. NFXS9 TaxID=2818433 RepID=UPI0032DF903A
MTASTDHMTHTLSCRMQPEPAALERLCQVARIRGFRIEEMQVRTDAEGLAIDMVLSGQRSIDMLRRQIEKLHTVCSLRSPEQALTGIRQSA